MHNQMLLLKPSHVFFQSIDCEPFFSMNDSAWASSTRDRDGRQHSFRIGYFKNTQLRETCCNYYSASAFQHCTSCSSTICLLTLPLTGPPSSVAQQPSVINGFYGSIWSASGLDISDKPNGIYTQACPCLLSTAWKYNYLRMNRHTQRQSKSRLIPIFFLLSALIRNVLFGIECTVPLPLFRYSES